MVTTMEVSKAACVNVFHHLLLVLVEMELWCCCARMCISKQARMVDGDYMNKLL